MRLSLRKALAQLGLFTIVLIFILFLNRPTHANKTFAWATVRYKTTAKALPERRGVCPGTIGNHKPTLVVARTAADGDAQWLYGLGVKYHLCIYYVDAPINPESTHLQVPANRGHEAMAYLTFIIDNYDELGPAVVFTHGSRYAWHNDQEHYDNSLLLHDLDVARGIEPHGYSNLRCDWSMSTCPASSPPQGSLSNTMQAAMSGWDARAASDAALPRALESIFGNSGFFSKRDQVTLGRTDVLRAQCCGQFIVSSERIKQHTRDEYINLRQWLLDGPRNRQAAPRDDRVAGRIMSYVWHILFLPHDLGTKDSPPPEISLQRLNQMACPSAADCYCRLYNKCHLDCPTPESCKGQYRLPPGLKLPDNWPNVDK